MSPGYFCESCDDVVVGHETIDSSCVICTRQNICNNILYNYYFSCIMLLNLPSDVIRKICFDCIRHTSKKYVITVHNCCWRSSQKHFGIYVPNYIRNKHFEIIN